MKTKAFLYTFILVVSMITSGCDGILDETSFGVYPETQEDMTNISMRVGREGIYLEGQMPASAGGGVTISNYPQTVQVSAGVLLFFNYYTNNNNNLCYIYVQVEGSKGYWKAPVEIDGVSGQPYARVLIPNFIKKGNFRLVFSVEDCDGNISDLNYMNTLVTEPLQCGDAFSGSVGVTVLSAYLGGNAGIASVNYEMYSIPDKLDIRYNNQWVASTNSAILGSNEVPNCENYPTGYVSGSGTLQFNYNPAVSSYVEVYVTGCDVSTAWDVKINCP